MNHLKLICLNTAGNKFPGVPEFIACEAKRVDIFCFQEIIGEFRSPNYPVSLHRTVPYHADQQINLPLITHALNPWSKDKEPNPDEVLHSFMTYFSPHDNFLETFAPQGNMIAVRKLSQLKNSVKEFDFGSIHIFAGYERSANVVMPWILLGADILSGFQKKEGEKRFIIASIHGLWQDSIKTDTDLKIEQSKRIVKALDYLNKRFDCEIVLAGDFNLLPDTKSISIIEEFGLRNLIKEFGITDTRGPNYKKGLRFADYVFVTDGIDVHDFKVLPDPVSDHLPLFLEFSVA